MEDIEGNEPDRRYARSISEIKKIMKPAAAEEAVAGFFRLRRRNMDKIFHEPCNLLLG